MRVGAALILCLWLVAPAAAQTQAEAQMSLYIQELEERVRQLTGENERLAFEVNQLRAALGMPPLQGELADTGAVTGQDFTQQPGGTQDLGAQELGTLAVSPDDPPVTPDGATGGATGGDAPVDLSALAGGVAGELFDPQYGGGTAGESGGAELPATTALDGSARDEYDLAYGYILTGDYDLAEESFRVWLANFPGDPQGVDAQFWLGESHLQQGEYRDAANAFLAVYKAAPDGNKGPDALLKLGVSLAALGEAEAACATFAEVSRRYPNASESLMSRVHDEQGRAGC